MVTIRRCDFPSRSDRDDSSTFTHHLPRFSRTDNKPFNLGIECGVHLFQGDIRRRIEEMDRFRSGVTDKDIQWGEPRPDLFKQAFDLIGLCHVRLKDRAVRASLSDHAQRFLCCGFVLVIVNGDCRAGFR
jgi:hypothetical protein